MPEVTLNVLTCMRHIQCQKLLGEYYIYTKQVQCNQLNHKFQDLEKVPTSEEKNKYYILSYASASFPGSFRSGKMRDPGNEVELCITKKFEKKNN